jgi:hypothetical protein
MWLDAFVRRKYLIRHGAVTFSRALKTVASSFTKKSQPLIMIIHQNFNIRQSQIGGGVTD